MTAVFDSHASVRAKKTHHTRTRRVRVHPRKSATVNNARFIIQISKGLIRDQRARRLERELIEKAENENSHDPHAR